jgi:hypothetical protein
LHPLHHHVLRHQSRCNQRDRKPNLRLEIGLGQQQQFGGGQADYFRAAKSRLSPMRIRWAGGTASAGRTYKDGASRSARPRTALQLEREGSLATPQPENRKDNEQRRQHLDASYLRSAVTLRVQQAEQALQLAETGAAFAEQKLVAVRETFQEDEWHHPKT